MTAILCEKPAQQQASTRSSLAGADPEVLNECFRLASKGVSFALKCVLAAIRPSVWRWLVITYKGEPREYQY